MPAMTIGVLRFCGGCSRTLVPVPSASERSSDGSIVLVGGDIVSSAGDGRSALFDPDALPTGVLFGPDAPIGVCGPVMRLLPSGGGWRGSCATANEIVEIVCV